MKCNIKRYLVFMSLFIVLTACSQDNRTEPPKDEENTNVKKEPESEQQENENNDKKSDGDLKDRDQNNEIDPAKEQVLMIIDQTQEEPPDQFYFSVKKLPDGYSLAKMAWQSNHDVTNTYQEAISNGGTGNKGFYISGNGQFMGFSYDSSWKGETGEVILYFENEAKEQVTWQKTITLQ